MDWQKEKTAETISLHGLGFLQVQLATHRLHVWHPDLPKRRCFEHSQIHNHRFGFISTVLVGGITNMTFEAFGYGFDTPGQTHMAYRHEGPRTKYGNRPWKPYGKVELELAKVEHVSPGGSYRMAPYVCHATKLIEPKTATLMLKTTEGVEGATSLCAIGVEPDVDFDRKQMSEGEMWAIVLDVLGASELPVKALSAL